MKGRPTDPRQGRPEGLHYDFGAHDDGRSAGPQTCRSYSRSAGLRACLALALALSAAPAEAQTVTFSKDVAPLLIDRCGMCHHPGGSAPFSLLTYADVKRRATEIATVTARRFMPPWKADPADGPFVGQHPLTGGEIAMLQRWSENGAPEGDSRQSSVISRQSVASRQSWADGWQLGTPDLVITLPQAYTLPPEGTDA